MRLVFDFDEPVTASPQTPPHTTRRGNVSDDDFQTCPQMPRFRKGKGKVVYPQQPEKKKLRSSSHAPPKAKVIPKQPVKRTVQHRGSVARSHKLQGNHQSDDQLPDQKQTRQLTSHRPAHQLILESFAMNSKTSKHL